MLRKKYGTQIRMDLRDTFVELLEASVHHVLATRSIYPKSVFTKQLFGPAHCGVPIMVSQHPDVTDFITEGITGLKDVLYNPTASNSITQFDIVIIQNSEDGEEIILEKYIFKFELPNEDDVFLKQKDSYDLEQNIRALLLCLTSRMGEMGPIKPKKEIYDPDYSFNFRLHTSRKGVHVLADDLRWCKIPSNTCKFINSVASSPSDKSIDGKTGGFSICDMVKEKSETSVMPHDTKIPEKLQEIDGNVENKYIKRLLKDPSDDDLEWLNTNQIKNSEVIMPVYQFNVPFKLKVMIEHSED